MKSNCHSCAYKRPIPGNTHIKCVFDFRKAETPLPKGNQHGIENGWYLFPLNYDPVWMDQECPHHAGEENPDFVVKPDDSLFGLLAQIL